MDEPADTVAIDLILELVRRRYGYDFQQYRRETLERVIRNHAAQQGCPDIGSLIPLVLYDREQLDPLLQAMTVNATELFRDPAFFRVFREQVIPQLQTFPRVGIWLAGCASGEEIWSVAILLRECGLLDRTQLYATDINTDMLDRARAGEYDAQQVADAGTRYLEAGGQGCLADYFDIVGSRARVAPDLRRVAMVSRHNLATDDVFAQVQVVFCRNVLIYFENDLKRRVFELFSRSLCVGGYLCLGAQEAGTGIISGLGFELAQVDANIYRKRCS